MRVFFVFAVTAALLIYSTGLWAPYHLDDPNVLRISQTPGWGTRTLGFASFWLNRQLILIPLPDLSNEHRLYLSFCGSGDRGSGLHPGDQSKMGNRRCWGSRRTVWSKNRQTEFGLERST